MKEEVKRWLEKAERDMDNANFNFGYGRYEEASFFAQQSVEKALKSLDIKIGRGNFKMGKVKIKHLKEIKEFKKQLEKEISIDRLILFGSRVKGNVKKFSDFDILVVSKKFNNVNKLERSYNVDSKWNLEYPVDFLCYTPEEFNKLKKQITIVRTAVKEGIEI